MGCSVSKSKADVNHKTQTTDKFESYLITQSLVHSPPHQKNNIQSIRTQSCKEEDQSLNKRVGLLQSLTNRIFLFDFIQSVFVLNQYLFLEYLKYFYSALIYQSQIDISQSKSQ